MQISKMSFGPHVEGIIRVATKQAADTQGENKIEYLHEFEILARHHDAVAASEDVAASIKLAQHPLAEKLLPASKGNSKDTKKLVEIPITMFFNKASNAIAAKYQAYTNESNRPVCTGNGDKAQRINQSGGAVAVTEVNCAGAEVCEFAQSGQATCRRQVSMSVQVKGQENPLNVFEVRTSSYNSYKALYGQAQMIEHQFGGLRHVPLKLQLWKASNKASDYESFDLIRLAVDAESMIEAMAKATASRKSEADAGMHCDLDGVFEPLMAGAEFNQADDDFAIVQDFYEVKGQTIATRREGSTSFAADLIASKTKGANITAQEVLRNALSKSAPKKSEEITTEG